MKPIGGYFELECGHNPPYYSDGIYLNLCRSAIRYLIQTLRIKKIYVPHYTCDVVFKAIEEEGCIAEKYPIDKDLMPAKEFSTDDFIIYNNYFGVIGKKIRELSSLYPNLIVDNAQAFYSKPPCRATIYSPRKFFGLPDGGILRGKDIPNLNLPTGNSFHLCSHLLKRIDIDSQAGYADFVINDKVLEQYHLAKMSKLTESLMGNIDYTKIKELRLRNFKTLKKLLPTNFPISMSEEDVPMVYPYITTDISLRQRLINNKIFVATYWPNVIQMRAVDTTDYNLAMYVIPLPIDQRYTEEDMERIALTINNV